MNGEVFSRLRLILEPDSMFTTGVYTRD